MGTNSLHQLCFLSSHWFQQQVGGGGAGAGAGGRYRGGRIISARHGNTILDVS